MLTPFLFLLLIVTDAYEFLMKISKALYVRKSTRRAGPSSLIH